MDTVRICKQCRQPLPEHAPEGLCPLCAANTASGEAPGAEGSDADEIAKLAKAFPELEIIEEVRRGGMGAVYKANQPELNRRVALKIILPEHSKYPAFIKRIKLEAQALAKLSHSNIVTLFEYGKVDDLVYFLMEFVDGVALDQLICQKQIHCQEAQRIVIEICHALKYAHEEGIVHRDIKPSNILLDKKGRVKIADFGIAKILGPDAGLEPLTGAEDVIGSPGYMAPEQKTKTKPRKIDHRVDIYSLGVVFYEMLTGELPCGDLQPPLRQARVDVRLDAVLVRALKHEPAERFQDAGEFKTAVEALSLSRWPRWLSVSLLAMALLIGAAIGLKPLAQALMDLIIPPTTEQRMARARQSLEQFDLEHHIPDAIHQLELAKEKAPGNTDLRALLGLAYWRSYWDTQSIEERTKAAQESALATNMNSSLAYFVQGKVALDIGKTMLPEAVRLLRRADELYKGNDCETLVALANAFNSLEDATNAARTFEKAVKVSKSWLDYNNLGYYYFHAGNAEAALTNFQLALDRAKKESPFVWLNYGGVLQFLNRTNEALRAYDESLKLRKTPDTYYLQGNILYQEKDWPAAAKSFLRAADLCPTNYLFWGYAGMTMLHITNRQIEARPYLESAIEVAEHVLRDKPDCEVRARVGLYHAGLGHTKEAGPFLHQALDECSSNPTVLLAAIEAYIALDDKTNADRVIEMYLDLSRGQHSALEDAIDFYRQLGETAKADKLKLKLDKMTDTSDK